MEVLNYPAPPMQITTTQHKVGGGTVWKAQARGEQAMRSREIWAIQELLRRIGCDPARADDYRPHKTDESLVVLVT